MSTGTGRVHAILWPTLVALAGVLAVVQPGILSLVPDGGADSLPFDQTLASSSLHWLMETLPIVLAGALAVFLGQRKDVRPPVGLAVCLVAGSTLAETVGIAAVQVLGLVDVEVAATIYAISSTLLAGAWLAVRGRGSLALLASPLAGVASWFAFPTLAADISGLIRDRLGTGTLAIFVESAALYALEVLVIGVPTVVVLLWRRARQGG
jgi:hypothetical protein